jgi:hypothetical protein
MSRTVEADRGAGTRIGPRGERTGRRGAQPVISVTIRSHNSWVRRAS